MATLKCEICPGLTQDILNKLNSKGIATVLEFVFHNPEKITEMCGLPYKKMLSFRRYLLAQYSTYPINGADLYDQTMATLAILLTGSKALDSLLGAGIYTGEVTEVCGTSGSGKTQFCYGFCANLISSLEQNVIYIDTTGDFSPQRLQQIIKSRCKDIDTTSALNRIKVLKCSNIEMLEKIISEIRANLQTNDKPFYDSLKAVVVDSITAILSPTMFNSSYMKGLSTLQSTGRKLSRLAKEFAIAMLVVNNMTTSTEPDFTAHDGQYKKPALGRCWAFVPSIRLLLLPHKETSHLRCPRIPEVNAMLIKSTRSEEKQTKLMITEKGIIGTDE